MNGAAYTAISDVLQKCQAVLRRHYGSQLRGVALYGSVARNQPNIGSDIDLFVLLDGPFDYLRELRRIVDLLYPIQLGTDRLISAKPVPADEFEAGTIQLYRNAKWEGMFL
jgi:predicted nucleotidyltransferase